MAERLRLTTRNGKRRTLFILACVFALFFVKGTTAFADHEWHVTSLQFIPASSSINMSSIRERDNDGIYALNLVNRGKKGLRECFFMSGDRCIVTYDDGTSKLFEFNSIYGVNHAKFREVGGSEIITLEAIETNVSHELKQSAEVSVDELAAILGDNEVTVSYGEYWEEGDEILGHAIRTSFTIKVLENSTHDHKTALRERNQAPALCEATGMARDCKYCQICGKYFTDETASEELDKDDLILQMLGHEWGEWETVEPATEEKAGKARRNCSRCPARDSRIIPPGEHVHTRSSEMHWTKPTCVTRGLEEHYICTGCEAPLIWSDTENDYVAVEESEIRIPPSGHKQGAPEKGPVTPATCSSVGGYTLTYRCEKCSMVLNVGREVFPIDPDAHQWGGWTVTKAASEKEAGEEMRTCELCEKVETRVIPAKAAESKEKKAADAEKSSGTGRKAGVNTGDSSQIALWAGLLAAALAGVVLIAVIRRKNK